MLFEDLLQKKDKDGKITRFVRMYKIHEELSPVSVEAYIASRTKRLASRFEIATLNGKTTVISFFPDLGFLREENNDEELVVTILHKSSIEYLTYREQESAFIRGSFFWKSLKFFIKLYSHPK